MCNCFLFCYAVLAPWQRGTGGGGGGGQMLYLGLGEFFFFFPPHLSTSLPRFHPHDLPLPIPPVVYKPPHWFHFFFFSVKLFTIKLFYVDLYFGIYIFWTVPFSLHSLILSACCLVYHPSKLYYHASLLCLPVNPLIALCFLLFYKGCGSSPLTHDVVIGFHCLSCI